MESAPRDTRIKSPGLTRDAKQWAREEQPDNDIAQQDTRKEERVTNDIAQQDTQKEERLATDIAQQDTLIDVNVPGNSAGQNQVKSDIADQWIEDQAALELPVPNASIENTTILPQIQHFSRRKALIAVVLSCIVLFRAINLGATQFVGAQGWSYVLGGAADTTSSNAPLLNKVKGGTSKTLTPQQYIDELVSNMTLDEKLGQMMIVQFTGSSYSLPLSTMISQYHVGTVLLFTVNGNIVNQQQLRSLTQAIQSNNHGIPLTIATDQEGGYVNRLQDLIGSRPAEATIGASGDPNQARADGVQTAQDLSSFGINLNLAPVVDVDNDPNSEEHQDLRTYSSDPNVVTQMAAAYLQGLQQSGKVIGTLKHFPGLGDVTIDPHVGLPYLNRSRSELEAIDWAPYRVLIQTGQVHAIMVTHEIVTAVDPTRPASLSSAVIQGILRHELGYQGVIMTDSLTMAGVTDYATPEQAAALTIEAGSDMIIGASSPQEVAQMFDGITQAMNSGAISQQRIDASVRRILMMKYDLGLLPIPKA
jgi:beta-N-acetylhexosaminidase